MDACKKSILGYQVSDTRAVGPCILAMRMAFDKFAKFPNKALKFIADGYSAYPLAKQQFELEENKAFDLTQVIGLTNDDPVSTEYRWIKQIVERLDQYIIGQHEAKKAVAIALRNRYRRSQLTPAEMEEITPKNIIMKGPTGVGKTEIARRLAKLVSAPFVKVEATKFTEVGYVGRDVDSMVRDLVEASMRVTKQAKLEEKYPYIDAKTGKRYCLGKSLAAQLADPINLASPNQLAILFYDILKCPTVSKKSPRGTGKDELEAIAEKTDMTLCKLILERRGIVKLISTYIDVIPALAQHWPDGRIRYKLNSVGTDTGRCSSGGEFKFLDGDTPVEISGINSQNIPSRGDGKITRMLFTAKKEFNEVEVEADRITIPEITEIETTDGWKYGKDLKIGDTLTQGENLHFKGLPSFSPEMFKYIENADPMKQKQLAKGIDQLMDEGVAQLFVNQFNGRKIIGTVGQLQFEVIQYRLENEYNAKCRWEPISLYKACWIESDDEKELENFKKRKYQYMAKDREGRDVFLADSGYVLQMAQNDFKSIRFHFTSEF